MIREAKTEPETQPEPVKEPEKEASFKLVLGVNGQEKNLVLLSIKTGRMWNFKENFEGEDYEEEFMHTIWVKWGNPCNGEVNFIEEQKEEINLTVDTISEELSYFGDVNCVKDSLVSCYICFKDIDYEVLEGDFDCKAPFKDSGILGQVKRYLSASYPEISFEITHHGDAQKFNANLDYK